MTTAGLARGRRMVNGDSVTIFVPSDWVGGTRVAARSGSALFCFQSVEDRRDWTGQARQGFFFADIVSFLVSSSAW